MEHPNSHLQKDWHEKNEKNLTDYGKTSHYRAYWKCSVCAHEWQTAIANRAYGSNCPNCHKLKMRGNKNPLWSGHGEISGRMWHNIKLESTEARRSRRYKSHKALPFEITIEYAWELFLKQDRRCSISGELLTMWGKINGKYTGTASLDRIDSSKGYIEGNVQWVDKKLQHIKRNMKDEDFIAICKKIAAYQTEKSLSSYMPPSFKQWKTKVKTNDV